MQYENVPRVIGTLVSAGKATLYELQTAYSIEDAYNMLEIVSVDHHNERVLRGRHSN